METQPALDPPTGGRSSSDSLRVPFNQALQGIDKSSNGNYLAIQGASFEETMQMHTSDRTSSSAKDIDTLFSRGIAARLSSQPRSMAAFAPPLLKVHQRSLLHQRLNLK